MSSPDQILDTYDRVAPRFARERDKTLFEKRWLDRLWGYTPNPTGRRRVLDLGCGSGQPIAAYLDERGAEVTGVDGAAAMVALFRAALPSAQVHHADMRKLDLGRTFDAVIAWNSFFHLSAEDQRAMFAIFAAHAGPRAPLLFTTGHKAGTALGTAGGETVFHESLDPADYDSLLEEAGFERLAFVPEDPACRGHSVWLARKRS